MITSILKRLSLIALITFSANTIAADSNEQKASKLALTKYKATKLLKVERVKEQQFKVKLLLANGRLKTVFVNTKSGKVSERKK
ncbi:hypothetical protein [Psychrobium sp. 1_MG-2023]|uniref:hypothetical protein n=1 Tax=Psychrobium sp. 1_MG-2023 TaxID=3062624 RepID=UPI000C34C04E|nr:hypothetical protein [Psychrobium sp. 1_MG-2023]MDP2562285.1 hypothetical protein [Psychrobium sp. 1_MG-2023]PKF54668.1 hypothetical protein CW748_15535 [Alteromonadales bacterium alter-6D02]